MAVWHSVMAVGAINTSWSHTVEQNFATPRSVWAYTMLTMCSSTTIRDARTRESSRSGTMG
jgi:hypothetical protein